MAGAGFSGKDGTVKIATTDVAEIRNWKFNPKSNNPRYASNKTSGYKRTVAGVKEGSGSMSGAWDHSIDFLSVVDVGTAVTLKLYTNSTHFFSVPSVIDDCSINVDVENGEIVSWDSNFSTDGAWTNPASPMMMPMTMGAQVGAGGGGALPPGSVSPFSPEQLAMIAQVAANAAAAAIQSLVPFSDPTQSSEPRVNPGRGAGEPAPETTDAAEFEGPAAPAPAVEKKTRPGKPNA